MKVEIARLLISSLLLPTAIARADFKYSETRKISGGAMAGLVKFAGSVSGSAERPMQSTKYVRGNRMRIENSDGSVQIIDLDGRCIIAVDSARKTYGVITFDEMRAQAREMQQHLQAAKRDKDAQLNLSPTVEVTATQNTRSLLGETTRQVQVRVNLNMQTAGGASGRSEATMSLVNDLWVAPSVRGYDEVKEFYRRLAEGLNWVPAGGAAADPRMAKAMAEALKNAEELKGMPLLEVLKLSPIGNSARSGGSAKNDEDSETASRSETTNGSVMKDLSGVLGGFGKKKKEQPQVSQQDDSDSSLMTTTVEVTSFSSSALDSK
jgi:hypothetical protein